MNEANPMLGGHSTKQIKARHEACNNKGFEPFKVWAVGLAAHVDRGVLLRRLEAAEIRNSLEIRKVRSWFKWVWVDGKVFPRRKVLGFRYFCNGVECDIHGKALRDEEQHRIDRGLDIIDFPTEDVRIDPKILELMQQQKPLQEPITLPRQEERVVVKRGRYFEAECPFCRQVIQFSVIGVAEGIPQQPCEHFKKYDHGGDKAVFVETK